MRITSWGKRLVIACMCGDGMERNENEYIHFKLIQLNVWLSLNVDERLII